MKQIKGIMLLLLASMLASFTLDIKVSDQYPTILELNGTIEKVSFGNGNKEYVANQEGRFLEIKARRPATSKTSITIYYLNNEGKKNERIDLFFGTISYDPAIQPLYNLTKDMSDKQVSDNIITSEEPISKNLSDVIAYIEQHPPMVRRFARTKHKISCTLSSMISTGDAIVFKFVFKNNSPYNYQIGESYFVVNNKEQSIITPTIKPSNRSLAPGEMAVMIFVIAYKVKKEGLVAHFEEKNGARDISIPLPNPLLLRIPFWQPEPQNQS